LGNAIDVGGVVCSFQTLATLGLRVIVKTLHTMKTELHLARYGVRGNAHSTQGIFRKPHRYCIEDAGIIFTTGGMKNS
jgi:hypothetical protein